MKITRIKTENFIGARAFDITLDKPVVFIVGKNYAGKTSIYEALRLALIGESVRVKHKKDYEALVSDGAKDGIVHIDTSEGAAHFVLPSGNWGENLRVGQKQLAMVLDAQRFVNMNATDRSNFLFGLMNVAADANALKAKLLERGFDERDVDEIAPFLRAGAMAAMAEAASRARECKASWRTMTGETYGKLKAATWEAKMPPFNADDMAHIEKRQKEIGEESARAYEALGMARSDYMLEVGAEREYNKLEATSFDMRERERIADAAEKKYAEARNLYAKAAPNQPAGHETKCPACKATVFVDGNMLILPPVVDKREDAHITAARRAYEDATAALQYAIDAAEKLKTTRKPNPHEYKRLVDSLEETAKEKGDECERLNAQLTEQRDAQRMALEARRKTDDARALHRLIGTWEGIGHALEQIPAELLQHALDPFNAELAVNAEFAGWPAPRLDAQMQIDYKGHPYALLSESEQWRVSALIAATIAQISGLRMIVLDRFDVLDTDARGDLVAWLDALAQAQMIDTALIFGTLSQVPSLPDTMRAHWIESGKLVEQLEAA